MKHTLLKQFYILAAIAPVLLNSCQSTIMSAAQRGDLATVRQAISAGVSVRNLNKAAAAAYSQGHTAVLAELVKAGAVVAPDSVAYKTIIFKDLWTWEEENHNCSRPELNLAGFDAYWNEYVWQINWQRSNKVYSPTEQRDKVLAWKNGNFVEVKYEHAGDFYTMSESRYSLKYQRTGVVTAFVTYDDFWQNHCRVRDDTTLYKLTFTSPTSGQFEAIHQCPNGNGCESRFAGLFWLKDASDSQN